MNRAPDLWLPLALALASLALTPLSAGDTIAVGADGTDAVYLHDRNKGGPDNWGLTVLQSSRFRMECGPVSSFGLEQPNALNALPADADGEVRFDINAPAGICDLALQAIDFATCEVSHVTTVD